MSVIKEATDTIKELPEMHLLPHLTVDTIGKRVLLRPVHSRVKYFGSISGIEECRVLGMSPSGNFVHLQMESGSRHWRATSEVVVVEELLTEPSARSVTVRDIRPER